MFKGLLSLFLKFPCPLCQRPAEANICLYCQKQLQSFQLHNPSRWWCGNLPVFSWGIYDGKLKRAIATMKYDRQPEIGRILGQWLAKSWQEAHLVDNSKNSIVVPIPLAPTRLKARGFNQATAIAQSFCQETGYSLQPQGLIRVRETQPMFNLAAHQRQENIQQAFRVGNNWQQKTLGSKKVSLERSPIASLKPKSPVLLLDDIYTTGTTVKEAARVLRQQGIEVFGVVVAARAISGNNY
jgi:ComF family protein